MNYPLFASLISDLLGTPPLIMEHLKPDQFAETRRKLAAVFAGRRAA